MVFAVALCVEVAIYEAEDLDMSWGLYSLYEAIYASLSGDARSAVLLVFASCAFLAGRHELAWAVLREVLGEERARQGELLLELGRLFHGLKRADVVITSEDLEGE